MSSTPNGASRHATRLRATTLLAATIGCSALVAAACTYEAQHGDLLVHVVNVPVSAVRAEVGVGDLSNPKAAALYYPRFGAGRGAPLDLEVAIAHAGTISVGVAAFDESDNRVADGIATVQVNAPAGTPQGPVTVTLRPIAVDGSESSRCKADDAGIQSCASGLSCLQYQGAASRGVCVAPCGSGGTCANSAGVSPAPTCLPTPQGQSCQWECDQADGGTSPCPPGLTCQPSQTGSKMFCQPPQ